MHVASNITLSAAAAVRSAAAAVTDCIGHLVLMDNRRFSLSAL